MIDKKELSKTDLTPAQKAGIAFFVPILVGWLLLAILDRNPTNLRATNTLFMTGLGLSSWFIGLRWYGLAGMGLRGRRPLFASIGFAVLGWVVLLIARAFVISGDTAQGGLSSSFFYLLLFEAFSVQLWAFGPLFRAVYDWRGAPSAVFASAFAFGMVAFSYFEEARLALVFVGFLYFLIWGFFYAIIRLRTGSLLGTVFIQAMQTLTVWHILLPVAVPPAAQMSLFYVIATIGYLIFIWRLWPKEKGDYRV